MRDLHITSLLMATALVLSLGVVDARADHVFTLSGVAFDDGGTATGTFTTDNSLTNLVSYDITTSGGTLAGFDYTPATTVSFSSVPFILVLETTSLDHLIQLTFTDLTVAGSPITIGQFDSFEQDPSGAHRQVTTGSVLGASVPEPSSLALAGTAALAGLGLAGAASPRRLPGRLIPRNARGTWRASPTLDPESFRAGLDYPGVERPMRGVQRRRNVNGFARFLGGRASVRAGTRMRLGRSLALPESRHVI